MLKFMCSLWQMLQIAFKGLGLNHHYRDCFDHQYCTTEVESLQFLRPQLSGVEVFHLISSSWGCLILSQRRRHGGFPNLARASTRQGASGLINDHFLRLSVIWISGDCSVRDSCQICAHRSQIIVVLPSDQSVHIVHN